MFHVKQRAILLGRSFQFQKAKNILGFFKKILDKTQKRVYNIGAIERMILN
jgi:hypothetical protein